MPSPSRLAAAACLRSCQQVSRDVKTRPLNTQAITFNESEKAPGLALLTANILLNTSPSKTIGQKQRPPLEARMHHTHEFRLRAARLVCVAPRLRVWVRHPAVAAAGVRGAAPPLASATAAAAAAGAGTTNSLKCGGCQRPFVVCMLLLGSTAVTPALQVCCHLPF